MSAMMQMYGRAIAQAVGHRGGPSSILGKVMWDLWWAKWHWGRFLSSISVSPASSHFTKCYMFKYHPGLVQ
jgi:hypothetical protein